MQVMQESQGKEAATDRIVLPMHNDPRIFKTLWWKSCEKKG
jgi:hypothetical protein